MPTYEYRRRKPLPVDANVGDAEAFQRRYLRRYLRSVKRLLKRQSKSWEAGSIAKEEIVERRQQLVGLYSDQRNLWLAREHLRRKGGQAPGPDGIRLRDGDKREWFRWFREIKPALQDGTYEPGPSRAVETAKRSGQGVRTIRIANAMDRIISRGIFQFLSPLVDPGFDCRSFGFRPRLGVRQALVEAVQLAEGESRWHWVAHDLKDAFDRIPRERMLDLLSPIAPKPLLDVLRRLIGTESHLRVAQGSPVSPLLLNIYLDHHLDRRWRKRKPRTPLLRYADDLLVMCRSESEAVAADKLLRELLIPVGFQLKSGFEAAHSDLAAGQCTDWLGYEIGRGDGHVAPRIGHRAWGSLDESLGNAALEGDSSAARYAVRHWLKTGRTITSAVAMSC
jgi:RNA-directed DNA polymerase